MTSANSHRPPWRVEDEQLLRGRGRFIDDAPLAGQVYGCFVRSTHAHGKIRNIDIGAARVADGVLAVLTVADMKAAGVGAILRHPPMTGRNGAALIEPPRPALAGDRVMHIGEPLALVVATSAALAQDAAERVNVDYDDLRLPLHPPQPTPPETLKSTGSPRRPLAAPTQRRSRGSSRQRPGWRASRNSTSASQPPPWSRAAGPQAMMRRPTATLCGSARRARSCCAMGSLLPWASSPASCAS